MDDKKKVRSSLDRNDLNYVSSIMKMDTEINIYVRNPVKN